MTALSPLANLIAALQMQLTAAPAPESAPPPAPFLDVFGGLMAMPEPGLDPESEPQPQAQTNFRSQTESGRNPAPPPKAKKTADTGESVVTAQVMPTPGIVPAVPVLPIVAALPFVPVLPVEQVEHAVAESQPAPAPAVSAEAAPIAADSFEAQPVKTAVPDVFLKSDAPPVPPKHAERQAPADFPEMLRSAIGTPRQSAPDRPVQAEDFDAQLPPQAKTAAEAQIPDAVAPKPREASWQPPVTPADIPPVPQPAPRSFDVQPEAAPQPPENSWRPKVMHQPVPSPDTTPVAAADRPSNPRPTAPPSRAPEAEGVSTADRPVEQPIPLAFAAKLVPVAAPATPEPIVETKIEPKPQPKTQTKADAAAPQDSNTLESQPAGEPAPPRPVKIEAADLPRERKATPGDNPHERKIAAADSPDPAPSREAAPDSRAILPVSSHEASPAARTPDRADPTPAAPRSELPAEVAKPAQPPAAARDIRLELAGGDRKVEVRLMERGGEVHVAVRTPDTQLAGALRDSLPALSTRLEQTGMRAEAWHPAAEATGERRVETAQASRREQGDAREHSQSQGREQRDSHPRRSRETEDQINRKEKGTPFSWFMPSHT